MNLLLPRQVQFHNILLAEQHVAEFTSSEAYFTTELTNATKEAVTKDESLQKFKQFTQKKAKTLDGFRTYMRNRKLEGSAIDKQKKKDKMKTISNPVLPKAIQATKRRENLITAQTDISPTIL